MQDYAHASNYVHAAGHTAFGADSGGTDSGAPSMDNCARLEVGGPGQRSGTPVRAAVRAAVRGGGPNGAPGGGGPPNSACGGGG